MKKIIIITAIVGFIGLTAVVFYNDRKAKMSFCKSYFYGKVDSIKMLPRDTYFMKIKDDQWYYMHTSVDSKLIEVGDSLFKEANCYKVFLIKHGQRNNISFEGYLPCDCD